MMGQEIERKFMVAEFPTGLNELERQYIEQSYISINPEIRVRKSVKEEITDYKICHKRGAGLQRGEYEQKIMPEIYEAFLKSTGNKPITKEYRRYELDGGRVLEVSKVDAGTINEFMCDEVEFESVEEANNYKLSEYLKKAIEVTDDCYGRMAYYWKKTRM